MNKNWSIVPLSQITKEITIKSSENNQFPAITSSLSGIYIQTDYFKKTVASANNIGYKIISPGQFTYRSMSDDGVFKINRYKFSHKGIVSPAYSVFEVINGDASFIEQFFDSHVFSSKLYKIIQGGTRLALKYKTLREIDLELPPIQEQKKIASILTSVDDLIENAQSQIKKFQDLKKSVINELLTKGIGHTEFKDSELGRIPKEWKIYELNNVSEKIGDGLHATPKYTENSDFYFINGNNLFNGKIIFGNSTKKISKEEFKKHYIGLGKNTILLSINGTIGNVAKYDFEKIILGKSAAYINLKKNILRDFIYYCLQSNYISKYFNFEVTGTTIKNLSLKSIKKIKIKFPLIKEQNLIVKILNHKENNIIIYNQLLKKYKNLKKSLMQDLLTGKVRVSVN